MTCLWHIYPMRVRHICPRMPVISMIVIFFIIGDPTFVTIACWEGQVPSKSVHDSHESKVISILLWRLRLRHDLSCKCESWWCYWKWFSRNNGGCFWNIEITFSFQPFWDDLELPKGTTISGLLQPSGCCASHASRPGWSCVGRRRWRRCENRVFSVGLAGRVKTRKEMGWWIITCFDWKL